MSTEDNPQTTPGTSARQPAAMSKAAGSRPTAPEAVTTPARPGQPRPPTLPQVVVHRFAGRLLGQDTNAPLVGYTVRAYDLDAGPQPTELGYTISDASGIFTLAYTTTVAVQQQPSTGTGAGRRLQLHILNPQGQEIAQIQVQAPSAQQQQPMDIALQVPTIPALALSDLATQINLQLPPALLPFLAQQNIHTLDDVRQAGGIAHLSGLTVATSDPAVRALEAHANLSLLPSDVQTNNILIQKGYTNLLQIARTPAATFVSALRDQLGEARATQIYVAAHAQADYLNNLLTAYRANAANRFASSPKPSSSAPAATRPDTSPSPPSAPTDSGTPSPSAHSTGLPTGSVPPESVPYVLTDSTGGSVGGTSFDSLVPTLGTSFPLTCHYCGDCEAAVSPLAYLADLLTYTFEHVGLPPTSGGSAFMPLSKMPDGLINLSGLLQQPFGDLTTSCEAMNQQVRQVRLCIEVLRGYLSSLTPLPDTSKLQLAYQTYLQNAYTALLTQAGTSYNQLRLIRGANSTARAALASQLGIALSLTGSTDQLDQLLLIPATSTSTGTTPAPLTEAALEQLFGLEDTGVWQLLPGMTGTPRDPLSDGLTIGDTGGQITHWNLSGVTWNQDTDADGVIYLSLTNPGATTWQVDLYADGGRTRQVASGTSTGATGSINLQPMGDSALTGTVDINYSADSSSISLQVFPLLLCWHFAQLRTLWAAEDFPPDIPAAPSQVPGGSPITWPIVDPDLVGGPVLGASSPTAPQYDDFRHPSPGNAPYDLWNARRTWVDVQLASLQGVKKPDGTPDLTALLATMYSTPVTYTGISSKIYTVTPWASTTPLSAFPGLLVALGRAPGTPTMSATDALTSIQNDLHLTVESFVRLMTIKTQAETGTPNPPTAADWQDAYAILVQTQKVAMFPYWIPEEQSVGILLGPRDFWIALQEPPSLPAWLASSDARHQWQQDLLIRSGPPLIDPDLLGVSDFKASGSPPVGNPAYTLWTARYGVELQDLVTGAPGLVATLDADRKIASTQWAALDAMLNATSTGQETIGFHISDLQGLDALRQQGTDITARLKQLSLSPGAFLYLVNAINILSVSGNTLLDSEWQDIYSILAQVWKNRSNAKWREEEKMQGITLGPDFFQIPAPDLSDYPPAATPTLPEWRATLQARQQWEDTLQARISQQQTTIDALQAAVGKDEQAALPALRDALVLSAPPPPTPSTACIGTPLECAARQLSEQLLIDMQMGGGKLTTRVEQAIETLQTLLSSLRNGELGPPVFPYNLEPDISGDFDEFDEAWQWLGSYATWRAAMFVYMYPENLLLPQLREQQTPAFSQMVSELRSNQQLTPSQARDAAATYAAYFQDICNLTIDATCTALTHLSSGGALGTTTGPVDRSLFYLFARGPTNSVYWSVYDPQDGTDYAQTFWDSVPGLPTAVQLIAAVPYMPGDSQHSMLLFAKVKDQDAQKLVLTSYDLQQQSWSGSVTTLSLPEQAQTFSAVVGHLDQSALPPGLDIRPRVVMLVTGAPGSQFNNTDLEGSTLLYTRFLNDDSSDWESADFLLLAIDNNIAQIYSVMRTSFLGDLGEFTTNDVFAEYLFPDQPSPSIARASFIDLGLPVSPLLTSKDWTSIAANAASLGVFRYRDSYWVYVYAQDLASGIVSGVPVILGGGLGSKFAAPVGLNHFALNHGFDPSATGITLAYQTGSWFGITARSAVFTQDPASDALSESMPTPVKPLVSALPELFNITERFSAADLQLRASLIQWAMLATGLHPASNLTYLQETYYFVPMYLALQLQQAGHYTAALDWFRTVYDYSQPEGQRNIYYGLTLDTGTGAGVPTYPLPDNWLLDPLNSHAIAASREDCYVRYTIMAIVGCFLAFADARFTVDTSEATAEASALYMTALDLLDTPELQQQANICDAIGYIDFPPLDGATAGALSVASLKALKRDLATISDRGVLSSLVSQVQAALAGNGPLSTRLADAHALVARAQASQPPTPRLATVLSAKTDALAGAYRALLVEPAVVQPAKQVAEVAGQRALRALGAASATARTPAPMYLGSGVATAAPPAPGTTTTSTPPILYTLDVPAPVFCIPPNPLLQAVRQSVELSLYKLNNGLNIAGMARKQDPYSAPTDTRSGMPTIGTGGQLALIGQVTIEPTLYRYSVVVDRAKQLVTLAQQVEAAMLAALEKRDNEAYTLLQARQALALARANVALENLRVTEAQDNVQLAQLQVQRAQIQQTHYQDLINSGEENPHEKDALDLLLGAAAAQAAAAAASGVAAWVAFGFSLIDPLNWPNVASSISSGLSETGSALSSLATYYSTKASYERRLQDWQLQLALANQDILIGNQQFTIAQDGVQVAAQQQQIASMTADNAETTATFLANKFTNAELYDWMSGVLKGVYAYLLQQATAMAQLAANQLAFERQQVPPPFIQADYWEPPSTQSLTLAGTNGQTSDRAGLTGAERLLQDITELDQYAFTTDQRKLQLTKTVSLVQLDPFAFQQFRETGVLRFTTPMDLFDRDFPGHYLRLIRQVRVSVIALIPPMQGIRATFSTTGLSNVVIGGDLFQSVRARRSPEMVALSSPQNATGLFDLSLQSTMLLPFEDLGVATSWELQMPKTANLFDYSTIADVLFSLDYTALYSDDYRRQIIGSLDQHYSAQRPYSFHQDLADQWYDLNNSQQTATPMIVTFTTAPGDFPPNLINLEIQHVALYFVPADGSPPFEVTNVKLTYAPRGGAGIMGGVASTSQDLISTRSGNGSSWLPMLGKSPFGTWTLDLSGSSVVDTNGQAIPNSNPGGSTGSGTSVSLGVSDLFAQAYVSDLLFVITYAATLPDWPT